MPIYSTQTLCLEVEANKLNIIFVPKQPKKGITRKNIFLNIKSNYCLQLVVNA